MQQPLTGMKILVLEDEFLIAMDVEQLCRDHGAEDVVIMQTVDHMSAEHAATSFDAAVVDLMLNNQSTIDYARKLQNAGMPFVFASGYTDTKEMLSDFPEVVLVSKPYAGSDLIEALVEASSRRSSGV
ncbi:response regulator [Corticibacterium sp. UT-5YL-CI-8]|nr:response regulator [Tianweitania sp. UT-5YL-CI-8]